MRGRGALAVRVAAELVLTVGVLILLYLAWQLWWNDALAASGQTSAARARSEQWAGPTDSDRHATAAVRLPSLDDPPVRAAPGEGGVIANLYVPRFGPDYVRTIAEGTGTDVLNSFDLGLGHYDGTQMPGQVGNFAVAGHRSAYGGALHLMDRVRTGDPIVVETEDGWYVYTVTGVQVVEPTEVGVIAPVPGSPGTAPTERSITLTTCTPLYSTAQRMVTTGVFDSWWPRAGGPPPMLAAGGR